MKKNLEHLNQWEIGQEAIREGTEEVGTRSFLIDSETGEPDRGIALQVYFSELYGWDRISVVAKPYKRGKGGALYPDPDRAVRPPTPKEVRFARRLFWEDDEIVYEIIGAEKPEGAGIFLRYLMRPQCAETELPLPPKWQKLVNARITG